MNGLGAPVGSVGRGGTIAGGAAEIGAAGGSGAGGAGGAAGAGGTGGNATGTGSGAGATGAATAGVIAGAGVAIGDTEGITGAATRTAAGALAMAPPKSSATDSAGPTSMMLEHTEQRARTPVAGTFAGSIRNTVRQLTQVTFTLPFLRGWME
jgi:hypothetical protein